jgi:hypothetical protein
LLISSLVKNKESNSFVCERKACKLSIADSLGSIYQEEWYIFFSDIYTFFIELLNLRNSCFLIRLPLLSLRLSGSIVIRRTLSWTPAPNSDDDACSLNMFKISNASSFSFPTKSLFFVAHDYFIYRLIISLISA